MLLLALLGCKRTTVTEQQVDGLRWLTYETRTDSEGFVDLPVDVQSGETAMLSTTRPADPELRAYIAAFDDFEAEPLWGTDLNLTNGIWPSSQPSFGWPIRATDEPLTAGEHTLSIGVIDPEQLFVRRAELTVDVMLKKDAEPGGLLEANIIFAGEADGDEELEAAVDTAIDEWKGIYADELGIDVNIAFGTHDNGNLDIPGSGSTLDYESISDSTPVRSVNVVIVPEIALWDAIYGVAGDIPGPLIASGKSAVLLSAAVAAGPDGRFSPVEIRILGETMAHEVGHFLGLFHPVEIEYDLWDDLADTPDCESQQSCVSELSDNLMFPFPVCGPLACTPQQFLTDDQSGVVQSYVGVQ